MARGKETGKPPFEIGERVRHRGSGLEAVLVPFLANQDGTVCSVRPAYKRPDEWVAEVLFDGGNGVMPIECKDLEYMDSTTTVKAVRRRIEDRRAETFERLKGKVLGLDFLTEDDYLAKICDVVYEDVLAELSAIEDSL